MSLIPLFSTVAAIISNASVLLPLLSAFHTLQLRTLCTANSPGKVLTDIMGTDWLDSLTSGQVRTVPYSLYVRYWMP